MGWASGSRIAEDLWIEVRELIPDDKRQQVAKKFIEVFEGEDCDTIGEAERLVVDAGMEDRY